MLGNFSVGPIRLRTISDLNRATLHNFIAQVEEPGGTVSTDEHRPKWNWMVMLMIVAAVKEKRELATEVNEVYF